MVEIIRCKGELMTAAEIADAIRSSDEWDMELNAALCGLADMENEWATAGSEDFEAVVYAAADKLGVEI